MVSSKDKRMIARSKMFHHFSLPQKKLLIPFANKPEAFGEIHRKKDGCWWFDEISGWLHQLPTESVSFQTRNQCQWPSGFMKSLLIYPFFWILWRKSHLLHLDSLDQQIWQVLVDCHSCNPVVTWRNMDMFRTVDSFKTEKKKRNPLDICGPGNSAGDLIGKVKWLFKSLSDLLL